MPRSSTEGHTNAIQPGYAHEDAPLLRRRYITEIQQKWNASQSHRESINPQSLRLIHTGRGSLAATVTVCQEDWESIETRRVWPRKL